MGDMGCQFRQRTRSRLVQFDTHPTRQIAVENGGIPGYSSDGSFSVRTDLPPNPQSDSSQSLSRTGEKRHFQAAKPYHDRAPDLTDWDAGRQRGICGSYRAILCEVSAWRPQFWLEAGLLELVRVSSSSLATAWVCTDVHSPLWDRPLNSLFANDTTMIFLPDTQR